MIDKNLVSKAKVAHHRNGVGGESFSVVSFYYKENKSDMIGIVFSGDGQVAVFDRKLLGEGIIEFGENSWRGDVFESSLREVIKEWENVK
jgi:hypothetical protein